MATPELPRVELATFRTIPPTGATVVEFSVHFNPETLEHSVANTLSNESGGQKKQYVDSTEATLGMTLVFDTTHDGEDVRIHTNKAAKLLQPIEENNKQIPPNVEFSWGAYAFTGLVTQYKETLEFFAADGIPLRATVQLTLSSQDVQFDSAAEQGAGDSMVLPAGGGGAAGLAAQLGRPASARAIAGLNGSASLRFGGEAGLAVSSGVELRAEAAFSVGAGAGFSFGIEGGVGVELGAGAGIGADFGTAFDGLRSTPPTVEMPSCTVASSTGAIGFSGPRAQFGVGGKANASPGGGFRADVESGAGLDSKIKFD